MAFIGGGVVLGGAGLIIATTENPDDTHQYHEDDDYSWLGGLVAVAVGVGMAYAGLKIRSKETVNNDFYYSPTGYTFIIIDKNQVRHLKKRIYNKE